LIWDRRFSIAPPCSSAVSCLGPGAP